MLRKAKWLILCIVMVLTCTIALTSCEIFSENTDDGIPEGTPEFVASAYRDAKALGYEGTLDEFLALCKGEPGKDGVDGVDGVDGGRRHAFDGNAPHLAFDHLSVAYGHARM